MGSKLFGCLSLRLSGGTVILPSVQMRALSRLGPCLWAWGMVNDLKPVGPSRNIAAGNSLATPR